MERWAVRGCKLCALRDGAYVHTRPQVQQVELEFLALEQVLDSMSENIPARLEHQVRRVRNGRRKTVWVYIVAFDGAVHAATIL